MAYGHERYALEARRPILANQLRHLQCLELFSVKKMRNVSLQFDRNSLCLALQSISVNSSGSSSRFPTAKSNRIDQIIHVEKRSAMAHISGKTVGSPTFFINALDLMADRELNGISSYTPAMRKITVVILPS